MKAWQVYACPELGTAQPQLVLFIDVFILDSQFYHFSVFFIVFISFYIMFIIRNFFILWYVTYGAAFVDYT